VIDRGTDLASRSGGQHLYRGELRFGRSGGPQAESVRTERETFDQRGNLIDRESRDGDTQDGAFGGASEPSAGGAQLVGLS
jgi:hypothetical protein